MTKYYDQWTDYESVKSDYGTCDGFPQEADIVYAGYTYEDYDGNALLVFRRDGKLFENNDGHCSCYGLEHWEPEETSAEALLIRQGWPGLHESLQELGEPPSADAVDPSADERGDV